MKHPWRALVLLSVLGLVAAAPQEPGSTLTVTRKATKLRSQKRLFSPPVAELVEGDKLVLDRKEGAWLAAHREAQSGWLHESDVSSKPDVRLSGEGVRESYTASETSAARKGFNPEVERTYRRSNPDLEAAFELVDRLQAREVAEEALRAFLVEGGLWKEAQ